MPGSQPCAYSINTHPPATWLYTTTYIVSFIRVECQSGWCYPAESVLIYAGVPGGGGGGRSLEGRKTISSFLNHGVSPVRYICFLALQQPAPKHVPSCYRNTLKRYYNGNITWLSVFFLSGFTHSYLWFLIAQWQMLCQLPLNKQLCVLPAIIIRANSYDFLEQSSALDGSNQLHSFGRLPYGAIYHLSRLTLINTFWAFIKESEISVQTPQPWYISCYC